jgi:hypothetical protein
VARAQVRADPRLAAQSVPLICTQIRVARALIRWSAEELARHTTLSVTTIRRAELMPSSTALTRAKDQAIRRVLEQAGVEFIDAKGAHQAWKLHFNAVLDALGHCA